MFCQSIFNISSIKFQPFIYIKKHLLFANHMSIKSNKNINFVKTKSTKHQHLFNMKWMLIFHWCPTLNTFCKNLYFINLSSVWWLALKRSVLNKIGGIKSVKIKLEIWSVNQDQYFTTSKYDQWTKISNFKPRN